MSDDYNPILDTDSYKASHALQYPPGTTGMFSYLESRGGRYGSTVFFGLQHLLRAYLSKRVTQSMVDEAATFFAAHGEPFPRDGWQRVVDRGGFLPVRIRAVAEGTVVPTHHVLLTVESTDAETFWIASWIESMIVRLWYPITVATQSWYCKRTILEHLVASSDDPLGEIPFKLHDFGARGVSSRESASIGAMAHLVNFQGTDTVEGVRYANKYYDCEMAGFSIPAAEHSTITMWGKDHEAEAYGNMITQFGKPGATFACVSDSYDLWNAVDNLWADSLRDRVEQSGATVVIRPDSGDPPAVVLECLRILERKVGMRRNAKGFKVLPRHFRLIQGDGVNPASIETILRTVLANGYSASNVAFGMGGALLQQIDRDTQRFAFKCSSATVGGREVDVYKDPVTDPGKTSKRGRLDLVHRDGRYVTVPGDAGRASLLEPVFEDGVILRSTTLSEVRKRAEGALG